MRTLALTSVIILLSACQAWANSGQDAPDVKPRVDFRAHREAVTDLDFSHDGALLVSAGRDGKICLWDIKTNQLIRTMQPKDKVVTDRTLARNTVRRVESIAFSPDGKYVVEAAVEASGQPMLRLWDVGTGDTTRVLAQNADNLRAAAYSPDGKMIAYNTRESIGWKHKIVLCDPSDGRTLGELTDKNLAATKLAFSPDGKLLACAGAKKIRVWEVKERKLIHSIDDAHEKSIQDIAFSPNSKLLVSGSTDNKIRVWKMDTGKMDFEIEADQESVLAVDFSASGAAIISGGKDHTVKLWKTDTGKRYARMWGHIDRVYCVAASPDGKTIASGSGDTTVALWDMVEPERDADEDEDEEDEWGGDD